MGRIYFQKKSARSIVWLVGRGPGFEVYAGVYTRIYLKISDLLATAA
jgi:hypothetical protein